MVPGELGMVVLDPTGTLLALAANKAARDATRHIYPNGGPEADAFRHAAGSHLLDSTLGPERAKQWGDAHEVDGLPSSQIMQALGLAHRNTDGERLMDLYNNQVGRNLPPSDANRIVDAIKKDYFRKKPFGFTK